MGNESIVIAGYYGFGNVGDEAMLAVLIDRVRLNFPGVELVVLSQDPRATSQMHRVRSVNRWDFPQISRTLKASTCFILGGGSLLQDSTSQRSLMYYLGLIWLARRDKIPVFLLGQGIGPLIRTTSKKLVSSILSQVELILLRDDESYEQLRNLGIDGNKLLLGADLALLINYLRPVDLEKRERARTICVVPRYGFTPTGLRHFTHALDRICCEQSLAIRLLPFGGKQDTAMAESMKSVLKASVSIDKTKEDHILQKLRIIEQSTLLIGMRLHSLVFALSTRTPFIALSYDPKMERLVRQVESISGSRLPLWRLESLHQYKIFDEIAAMIAREKEMREEFSIAEEKLSQRAAAGLSRALTAIGQYVRSTR
jgi:polysaccharide pyruvyl transferase CsaB